MLDNTTGVLFILSILKEKEPLSFLSSFRLKREYFTTAEYKLIEVIQRHIDTYRTMPDLAIVELDAKVTFPELPSDSPASYWAKEVIKRYTIEQSHALLKECLEFVISGELSAAHTTAAKVEKMLSEGSGNTRVYTLESQIDKILEESNNARLSIKSFGVPFGLHFLDDQSGGAQGGDLITLAGLPSSAKTFTLQHMALSAFDTGLSVLFVPTEMSEIQYNRRFISLHNNLNINALKFGKLSTTIGEAIIKHDKEAMENKENKVYITDSSLSLSILDVKSAVYTYKPHAVYIDGAYLLRPEFHAKSKYEMVSSVAESLKILAKEMNIPIFATYQLNKKTEDIYQSAVVRQLSSIVIEMSDVDAEQNQDWSMNSAYTRTKKMKITKGRDGEEGEVTLILDTYHTKIIEPVPEETDLDD